MHAIECNHVTKRFDRFSLHIPKLCVEEGYVTGFVGENGAGKTTTIKLIMDMIFADEGQIRVFGLDSHTDAETIKQDIGYVGEKSGYLEIASLQEIKKMTAPFYKNWDESFYRKMIQRFSLDEQKKYAKLSRGMQKQFQLSLSLAHHPKLILMDEPTANLDPIVRGDIIDLLYEQMQQEGVSIFFSTHIISDLEKIADRLVFLHKGEILLQGDKDDIMTSHRIVRGDHRLLFPEVEKYLFHIEKSSFGFTAMTDRFDAVFDLLGKEAVYDRPTLEDIFVSRIKGERK